MANNASELPIDEDEGRDDDFDSSSVDTFYTTTSTRSIATSANDFRHENGRTYHRFRDGEYWAPNDAQQNRNEMILHHMCILTLEDRLFLAPLQDPKLILDVGAGTGIWAIDMADKFPDAHIIGTDLSPQSASFVPYNVSFEIDDCCSDWTYPESHFDFVHLRGMFGSIGDWPRLYEQAFKHLKPGGYIEHFEWSARVKSINGPIPEGSYLTKAGLLGIESAKYTGKTFEIAEIMSDLITQAGFTEVTEKVFLWPLGPWSSDPKMKEIGRWNLINWREGLEGWMMALCTRVLGWSYEEVQDHVVKTEAAMNEKGHHAYHEVRVVYARKP